LALARKHKPEENFNNSVFINCPFDEEYRPLFEAAIFTIRFLDFTPRSAIETSEGNETRIERLKRLISECRFGIHDLSRVELSKEGYPRFNMPFELGIDIGCAEYGRGNLKSKSILILDVERYRYQKSISDIAGQDISIYDGSVEGIIKVIRDWLHNHVQAIPVGSSHIYKDYNNFRRGELKIRKRMRLDNEGDISFKDYVALVDIWVRENR
jgi:hypothetical protein